MGRKFPSDGFIPELSPTDARGMLSSSPDCEIITRIDQGATHVLGSTDSYYRLPHDGLPYGVPSADITEDA